MTPLPNDYARCMVPDGCPLKNTCRRRIPVSRDAYREVITAYPGGTDCHGYISEIE